MNGLNSILPIDGIFQTINTLNEHRVFEVILAGYENEQFLWTIHKKATTEQKELACMHYGYLHEMGKNLRLAYGTAPPEIKKVIDDFIDMARSNIPHNDNARG